MPCQPNPKPSKRPPAPHSRPSAGRFPRANWSERLEKCMNSMSEKQLDEFASTKRKGKPEHVADKRH